MHGTRTIERTEIIDIKDKEVLWRQWDPFIVRTYFDCPNNFYKSRLASYPRRSCEALLNQTFYGLWVEENPFPVNAGFDELLSWIKPLVEAENNMEKPKKRGDTDEGDITTSEYLREAIELGEDAEEIKAKDGPTNAWSRRREDSGFT